MSPVLMDPSDQVRGQSWLAFLRERRTMAAQQRALAAIGRATEKRPS